MVAVPDSGSTAVARVSAIPPKLSMTALTGPWHNDALATSTRWSRWRAVLPPVMMPTPCTVNVLACPTTNVRLDPAAPTTST